MARRVCCFDKARWRETEFANESVKTGVGGGWVGLGIYGWYHRAI
jgi:hypothetical protein